MNLSEGYPELHVSQVTADLLTSEVGKAGSTIVGRRLYDITNGWNGHTGGEVPMVVLTHEAPDDWPRGGVPIHFVSGVEARDGQGPGAGRRQARVRRRRARRPARSWTPGCSTRSSSAWCR